MIYGTFKWVPTVEVNRARTVGVDFLDHHVQVLLGELIVQFPEDFA